MQTNEPSVSSQVLKIADQARTVLKRLDSGDRLSIILPQARSLANEYGDPKHVFWLDLEIYGLYGVPELISRQRLNDILPLLRAEADFRKAKAYGYQKHRDVFILFEEGDEKKGASIYANLHCILSIDDELINKQLSQGFFNTDATLRGKRDDLDHQSIRELERNIEAWRMIPFNPNNLTSTSIVTKASLLHDEHQRVLDAVRAYLHRLVSDILSWAEAEKENQAFLGRDYHIVINSLEALETGVGQELLAALGNLRSDNPANWALAALACRNVILWLGRNLFTSEAEMYESKLAARSLHIKGEMEKNKLCAFIDQHYQLADEVTKKELMRLDELARRIYEKGSQGKSTVRHTEAQQLVVDTFELVSRLEQLTGLTPITNP